MEVAENIISDLEDTISDANSPEEQTERNIVIVRNVLEATAEALTSETAVVADMTIEDIIRVRKVELL